MAELAGTQSDRGEEVQHRENGGISKYQNAKPRVGGRIRVWVETEGTGEAGTTPAVGKFCQGDPRWALPGDHAEGVRKGWRSVGALILAIAWSQKLQHGKLVSEEQGILGPPREGKS